MTSPSERRCGSFPTQSERRTRVSHGACDSGQENTPKSLYPGPLAAGVSFPECIHGVSDKRAVSSEGAPIALAEHEAAPRSHVVPAQGRDAWRAQTFRLPGQAEALRTLWKSYGRRVSLPKDFPKRHVKVKVFSVTPKGDGRTPPAPAPPPGRSARSRRVRRSQRPAGSVLRLSPSRMARSRTAQNRT